MYNIGEKIKLLRKKNNLTQDELAEKINITKQSVMAYETGKRIIPLDTLDNISKEFSVPIETFFSSEVDIFQKIELTSEITRIPIISSVSAGRGVFGRDDILDWLDIPSSLCKNANYATFVKGDSMEPKILDGDLILVKKVDFLDNGSIGIFKLNDDIFCKKYYENPLTKEITLKSINKTYKSIELQEIDEFYILGKVVCKIDYNF